MMAKYVPKRDRERTPPRPVYDSSVFTSSRREKMICTEISSLGLTIGDEKEIHIRSTRTGEVRVFRLSKRVLSQGELVAYEYTCNELPGWKLVLYND